MPNNPSPDDCAASGHDTTQPRSHEGGAVTEAEVEAAARAIYRMTPWRRITGELVLWEQVRPDVHHTYRLQARAALEAAAAVRAGRSASIGKRSRARDASAPGASLIL